MPKPISCLEQVRRTQGLTQAQLGELARVHPDTISRLERGDTPNLRTAWALARQLDVGILDLFPLNDNGAPRPTRRSHSLQPIGAAGNDSGG